jgi:hypothetical protein
MLARSIFSPILLLQGLLYRPILSGVLTAVLLTRLVVRRVAADVSNDRSPSSPWTASPRSEPLDRRYDTSQPATGSHSPYLNLQATLCSHLLITQ